MNFICKFRHFWKKKSSPVICATEYKVWVKHPPYLFHNSHLKMAIFIADWFEVMEILFTYYRPLASDFQ